MLTLYYAPGTCALASHLSLEHAKADYVAQRIDFRSEQQRSPAYLQINPKGRVPALATKDGVLTETPALLQYIAQLHPQSGLAPVDDPFALARAMTHIRVGICTPNQAGEDASYNAEPYTVQRPHPVTGEPFAATEYKNRVRP